MIDEKKILSTDIVIIGGGASGMIAALSCRKSLDENKRTGKIMILERHKRLGKKLLATGNGTCNISNRNATAAKSEQYYYGENPEFIKNILERFDVPASLKLFENIGMSTETEEDGKIYPVCRQASSVLNALEFEISSKNIEVRGSFEVTHIEKKIGNDDYFLITGIETKYEKEKTSKKSGKSAKISKNSGVSEKSSKSVVVIKAKKVILSAGGKASPALSSDGSGYQFARDLGHTTTETFPAITQINTSPGVNKIFQGQRWNVDFSLEKTNNVSGEKSITRKDYGEILFTDYGLSGPVALQISRHIRAIGKEFPVAVLDFMPRVTSKDLAVLLNKRISDLSDKPVERILIGLLPLKIANEFAGRVFKNSSKRRIKSITEEELSEIIFLVKNHRFKIAGTTGFEKAQVTAGGISCLEVDSKTCESLICGNLYFCGEILDVDGDCGGYNLQFAWSSGFLAGESAGKSL